MSERAAPTPEAFVRMWLLDNSRLLDAIVETHAERLGMTAPKTPEPERKPD